MQLFWLSSNSNSGAEEEERQEMLKNESSVQPLTLIEIVNSVKLPQHHLDHSSF